jgi:thymidylate kinase
MTNYKMLYSEEKIKEYKILKKYFLESNIPTLPIKLYTHDEDIDIVTINRAQYKKAKKLLIKLGFKDLKNISRFREPLKRQFISEDYKYIVHLHSTISWNGLKYLDPNLVWKRRIRKYDLPIPSPEDELLIIAAHSIFENKTIIPDERKYLKYLAKHPLDWNYIKNSARKYNWESALKYFLTETKNKDKLFKINKLLLVSFDKLFRDLLKLKLIQIPWQLFSYTFLDYVWCYRNAKKKINKKRIIVLTGLDGSGKTTQAKILHEYLTKNNKKVTYKHLIKKSTAHKLRKFDKKQKNTSLKRNVRKTLALYDLIKFKIFLNKNKELILCDRYFYDILVHIKYFKEKNNLFEKVYKKFIPPATTIFLELSPEESLKRKPEDPLQKMQKKYNLYSKYKNKFNVIEPTTIKKTHEKIIKIVEETINEE